MELQQKIDRITDILRRDDGISGKMESRMLKHPKPVEICPNL